jgi:hypothetical protein
MKHSRHRYEEPPQSAPQAKGFMRIVVGASKLAIMAGMAYLTYVALAPLMVR